MIQFIVGVFNVLSAIFAVFALSAVSFAALCSAYHLAKWSAGTFRQRPLASIIYQLIALGALATGLIAAAIVLTGLVSFLLLAARAIAASSTFIRQTLPAWITLLGASVALGLYRLRTSNQVVYGVLEIVVSIATMMMTGNIRPTQGGIVASSLAVAGAVYVFVRGLTNIRDGLSEGDRIIFERYFGGKKHAGASKSLNSPEPHEISGEISFTEQQDSASKA